MLEMQVDPAISLKIKWRLKLKTIDPAMWTKIHRLRGNRGEARKLLKGKEIALDARSREGDGYCLSRKGELDS